jgi:two-component system, OmpR family, sensor histidine kinase SenX3
VTAWVAALVGVAVGVGLATLFLRARGSSGATTAAEGPSPATRTDMPLPVDVLSAVLDALLAGAVVLDGVDDVAYANPAAHRLGVVRGRRLARPELAALVRTVRRSGAPGETLVELPDSREARVVHALAARTAAAGYVVLIIDDVTEARRLDAVRRDFVANVSHELKTPVGALALLAEAVQDGEGDPETTRRFAARMTHEAGRLSRLVQELIDLSRLQGADPLPDRSPVGAELIVSEATDRVRLAAEAKRIEVVVGGDLDRAVLGDERQLVTALANLLDNAIAYSAEGTNVSVGVRARDDEVEISVRDEGIGIAPADTERIFERFYRADPARSRSTGGTGLGLAIVKHIATNHGGRVSVWSTEGLGSTFTLHLPAGPLPSAGPAEPPAELSTATSRTVRS